MFTSEELKMIRHIICDSYLDGDSEEETKAAYPKLWVIIDKINKEIEDQND